MNNNPILKYFNFDHLPPNLKAVSGEVYALAHSISALVPDCAEKTAGLRKLLEAKDCFVRAALEAPAVSTNAVVHPTEPPVPIDPTPEPPK